MDMSFFAAIRQLMGRSGLQELLEVIYADTAVCHILTSKAISRAIRGHILIEAVLHAIILSKIYKVPFPFKEKEREENKEKIRDKLLKIRLILRNLSEKTEISSNPTNAVSLSDYD